MTEFNSLLALQQAVGALHAGGAEQTIEVGFFEIAGGFFQMTQTLQLWNRHHGMSLGLIV